MIKNLTDAELIEICNSLWDWKHSPPKEENSYAFLNLYNANKDLFENNLNLFNDSISLEALNRFGNLSKYLFTTQPHHFIK